MKTADFWTRVVRHSPLALLLDLDGTLMPFAQRPDLAQPDRLELQLEGLSRHLPQVEGGVERAAHARRGLGHARHARLAVGCQALPRQLPGERQHAIHLLTDVGGDALGKKLGQRHGPPGLMEPQVPILCWST